MTITSVMKEARKSETENLSWDDNLQCWYERGNRLNRKELKLARIARALIIMGMDFDEAEYLTTCTQKYHDKTLREVVKEGMKK